MIRAAVLEKPLTPIEIKVLPEPDLDPRRDVENNFSEVCGTDVHLAISISTR